LRCPNKYGLSAVKIWLKTPPLVLRKFCKFISEVLVKNQKNLEMVWLGFDLTKSIPKKALRSPQQLCTVCCKDMVEDPPTVLRNFCKFISGVLVKNPEKPINGLA